VAAAENAATSESGDKKAGSGGVGLAGHRWTNVSIMQADAATTASRLSGVGGDNIDEEDDDNDEEHHELLAKVGSDCQS
jgi:hypothetical protein